LKPAVKILFASGSEPVIARALETMRSIFPELPLIVVSEFRQPDCEWIPYHVKRRRRENRALIQSSLGDRKIRIGAVILEPRTPHWPLRLIGFSLAPLYFMAFTENGEHFMLRPRSAPAITGHLAWRVKNFVRWHLKPGGWVHKQYERVRSPRKFRLPLYYRLALLRGKLVRRRPPLAVRVTESKPTGISVVIPSRNGLKLLDRCLPRIYDADEIIVVDNGSNDATVEFLRAEFPSVVVEHNATPLSFARAVNRGIRRARYSHVCLLNNDMIAEPGFLRALRDAFDRVPGLFASTAQIFFPEDRRREETGKTAMPARRGVTDFPIRCEEPLEGEDLSPVLYGSGGCTLYDTAKLAALGGFDERYEPAYVEDLDIGVRAWQQGWPTVYAAAARVLHLHRATTSRYLTPAQLDSALEFNFIRYLAHAAGDRALWRENAVRLNLEKKVDALKFAARQSVVVHENHDFLDLVTGDIAVFPGKPASGKPVVFVVSPYLPFPLAHGAAVRIFNLMRRAARDFDQVLISFVETPHPVPPELREICVEVVTVRRPGTHALPSTPRPDTVEEFDSPAFHAVLKQAWAKWRPRIVQLEFTQMAQYAADCQGVRTILVEHDITYDLYAQMLVQQPGDWETARQHERWLNFEQRAWRQVDRVVVMSEKDRQLVPASVTIANGVDLERFQPSDVPPDPRRLLFIGSFAHKPNVLAVEFFLREVFPLLNHVTLHVIAGVNHERFWDLRQAQVEVEGFVADVRPAYRRATVVIAPLVASAGTNIKIMEAMAMGKAIVSTPAGVHGLEVGEEVVVAETAQQIAEAIAHLLDHPQARIALERHARQTAERLYDWNAIAEEQKNLYVQLAGLAGSGGVRSS
jgi:GT2 family glycosyltransferase/glycosyltransferase involved in cell wall biosynthesis